jgi:hypothetical protein
MALIDAETLEHRTCHPRPFNLRESNRDQLTSVARKTL